LRTSVGFSSRLPSVRNEGSGCRLPAFIQLRPSEVRRSDGLKEFLGKRIFGSSFGGGGEIDWADGAAVWMGLDASFV